MSKEELSSEASEEDMKKAIDRWHRKLGHPPNHDMIRILKHAQASEKAIQLARSHSCEFCKTQHRPKVALPAKTSRTVSFNDVVGLDVKNLPGFRVNQKVKALNIVRQGTCYQMMIPFHGPETSKGLRQLFADHWIRVFGPPRCLVLDPAATNMGEHFQEYLDQHGIEVRPTAAEAHWQLGRTENHGGWFERVQFSPS